MQKVTKLNPIDSLQLEIVAKKMFGNLVKAVVDVEQEIMIIDAELHADLEQELLKQGSKQENLWGINLYPEIQGEDFIEFDSMINLRPSRDNHSRGVDDTKLQNQIREVVLKLVHE